MKNMMTRVLLVTAFLGAAAQAFGVNITLPTNVGCSGGGGDVLCGVDPKMTYLLNAGPFNGSTFPSDGSVNPLVIDLQTVVGLGINTGDVLRLTAMGDMCFNYSAGCQSPYFGGVFSSSALFDTNNLVLNRVINAQSAPGGTTPGVNSLGLLTTNGGFDPNIAQDFTIFQAAGTSFVMPNISTYRYLFVGILDNYYGDNTDPDQNLQIRLTVVPEPGTYGLFLSGLGALLAFRRFRKN